MERLTVKRKIPILGFLSNPALRLSHDSMWAIYRVQELFEMPSSLFWSPVDYFLMLQSRKYVLTGRWGVSSSVIYFRKGTSSLLFDSQPFSSFPELSFFFPVQDVLATPLAAKTVFNRTRLRYFLRYMTGLYDPKEFVNYAWGLKGMALWPVKYARHHRHNLIFNIFTMSKDVLRNRPGLDAFPSFRFYWGCSVKEEADIITAFYYRVVRYMEFYSYSQELRIKRLSRWIFVYDLRFVSLVLREFDLFSFPFYGFLRAVYLVFVYFSKFLILPRRLPKHPFHMVSPSPWPLYTSLAALMVVVGLVQFMHSFAFAERNLALGLFFLLLVMGLWWRDVVREGAFEGVHTKVVQKGLKLGMVLFIVSEVLFFFAFFWAFFHSSLAPAIQIGSVWPPAAISVFDPWGIPLLNTLILLLSGLTITYTHHGLILGKKAVVTDGFLFTLFLAFLFTFFQVYEYLNAAFGISDGIYGSTFFMATGFHGFHVLVGTLFILVCFFRRGQFTVDHHVGFEAAAWYWHFVDVVWLFLFVTIYWWGSL